MKVPITQCPFCGAKLVVEPKEGCIDFGVVPTFRAAVADKYQAVKVLEEAAELFAAWQAWNGYARTEYEYMACERGVVDEACDLIQAVANLLVGMEVGDIYEALDRMIERNKMRGREYA